MHFAYAATLLMSILGLAVIDYRYQVAFFKAPKRAVKTIVVAMMVFIIWDLFGIGLDIFSHGNSPYSLDFVLLPEFPIEEILFLFLLSYTTLLLYAGVLRWRRM